MNFKTLILSFTTALLLSACAPEFVKPLTAIGQQTLDKRLIGHWQIIGKNETAYLHVGLRANKTEYDIHLIEMNNNKRINYDYYAGHSTTIEGKTYINIRQGKKKTSTYILAQISFQNKQLHIAIARGKPFKKAVANGILQGNSDHSNLTLSGSPENIRQFIIDNEPEIFTEITHYKRIGT